MPADYAYDYAIIRLVPRVERGEMINAGVILSCPDVEFLEVITEHNDGICSRDFVRNMKMGPLDLVAYHSNYMTLHPGDLFSTGCPKGARIQAGDRVGGRIEGVGHITATVIQGEKQPVY